MFKRLAGQRALLFLGSLLFSLYVLAPIAWLVSSSLQTEAEITSVPPHWVPDAPTMYNFAAIFKSSDEKVTYETRKRGDTATGGFIPSTAANLLPSMKNSFIVAVAVAVLNLLVAVPAAYALAKIRFIGRDSSIYFMLATRVIPDIALVVPFFLFVQKLGLMDNLLSLVITYLAITVPFSIFILTGYFESLPDELDKAARVDGCSRLQTLVLVFLPLALPSLVAVVLFTQTPASQTMPIVVASFASDFNISFSFINAAGVLAIVPPVLVAILFERYIVSGLTAGAVKG
jgi:multiple sugar transport system permease protein